MVNKWLEHCCKMTTRNNQIRTFHIGFKRVLPIHWAILLPQHKCSRTEVSDSDVVVASRLLHSEPLLALLVGRILEEYLTVKFT